jgi:hypothetical protein
MSLPPAESAPILSAEVRPSQDETLPKIEPNLADNEDLCKAVASHIVQDFFYPYVIQAERLYDTWNRIDDMWRATVARENLDIPTSKDAEDVAKLTKGIGTTNIHDARQAKVSPSSVHRQIDSIVNLGVALSWEGGEPPVKAKKPKEVFEHVLYNPTEQGISLANTELRRQAKEIGLKASHRIVLANCLKYGHAFALRDFDRKLRAEKQYFTLSADPMQGQRQLMAIEAQFGQSPTIETDPMGRNVACVTKMVVETMRTNFIPLDISAVFIDELMSCRPMERQPCPIVRLHINRWELEQNPYDPQANPFGWLNIDKAIEENQGHYALSAPDETSLRQRIQKRLGLSDATGGQKPRNTIKQLWTAYPLLAISEKGELDTGQGCPCPQCAGKAKVETQVQNEDGSVSIGEAQCPSCKGKGIYHPKTKRYAVQLFGNLYSGGSATVLRIQRNPTAKDKVPIIYTSHLIEDNATSRPVSKAEIALSAAEELATCRNQFLDSKSLTIRRGWMEPADSPFAGQPLNVPNARIKYESRVDEFKRIESNNYDETATIGPHIQLLEADIEKTFGANDSVVGEISAGRRAASEITLANEGSKRPLVNFIDQVNADTMGQFGWGQAVLDDLEQWGDRDYLVRRTGRASFGKVELDTAVGEEMLRAQDTIAQTRYLLETFSRFPQFAGILPVIAEKFFEASKIDIDISAIDQGVKKAQIDCFGIMARILGDGEMLPPLPDDPDEVFVGMFSECIRDIMLNPENHWRQTVPQNVPLLQQRLAMQQQQLAAKQMQQMQQQLAEQKMMNEANGTPNNNPPKRPNSNAQSPGEERQRSGK